MAQVVISAGGRGSRLRPITAFIPKPLVPVGGFPILDIIVRQLKVCNITDIVMATGYMSELIEAYFGKGKKWGVNIRYAKEDKALGTAGALRGIRGLKDNFLVVNGDIFTDINYRKILMFHLKHQALATLATVRRKIQANFGILDMGGDGRLVSYTEKPTRFEYVSIGINAFHKKCVGYISRNESIDIPELAHRIQAKNEPIYCFKTKAYWLDIGRFEDYQKAKKVFSRDKGRFLGQL